MLFGIGQVVVIVFLVFSLWSSIYSLPVLP